MTKRDLPTKEDVEEITGRVVNDVVGSVVGNIVGDAMQLISKRFDKVDQEFVSIQTNFNCIENRLNATTYQVDDHELRLRVLEHKAV